MKDIFQFENVLHDLEMNDMKFLGIIMRVAHIDQWTYRIINDRVHQNLNVDSVERVAGKSCLTWIRLRVILVRDDSI